MNLENLDRRKSFALLLSALLILGIVAVPALLQRLYGISAVQTAFVVIIVYAFFNWYLKRR